jgi:peptide methionine sulfoxide reductase MsrB
MSGCDDIGTTVFASELKDADTTRRLNSFDDNHDIPKREWLSTSINGYDSVEIFLENNRSEINFWGDDSQGIYVCAISRMVFISGDTIDSACSGITYVALDTSIYNDAMCALAVNTTRDSCDAHNIEYSAKMNYFTAHELGHAFNLSHCNSGCIMKTGLSWPFYYLTFCVGCETELGQQRP